MKKFLSLIAVILMSSCQVYAEPLNLGDQLSKIPDLNTGFAYSLVDNSFNVSTTIDVAKFGKYVNLEVGYAGAAEQTNHKAILGISTNLITAGSVDYPILKYIDIKPLVWVGYGNLNFKELGESEFDYGVGTSIFKLKF